MKISYRAISAPSSLVRRLRYLSQILGLVRARPLSKDVLAIKLRNWSYTHTNDLENYKYQTGAAHSIQKKRMIQLAINYIDLAVKFGLLSQISNVYQLTRIGRILLSLVNDKSNENPNLFCLREDERIFYIYQILQQDADFLLTVINMVQSLENPDNKNLHKNFEQFFLERLEAKILTSSQEHITRRLHDRQIGAMREWGKPESYAAYIVPSRLHWLLDLGLLDATKEKNTFIYQLTEAGQNLTKTFPKLKNPNISDVTEAWFNTQFFSEVSPFMICDADLRQWKDVNDKVRHKACEKYLPEAFDKFRKTSIPKISLTQGTMYLCIRFATEWRLLTNIQELIQWFQKPRTLDNYRYEARTSARENESYFVRRHE
ncbi:hypothetical protein F4X10_11485 [Candidatus Poribacteria bacterium]|nr:hypothetical protein [Candidatus Poribacteria bacterium]